MQSRDYPCFFMINIIKRELVKAYKEEDLFWQQKCRDQWLIHGDRSSKIFHFAVKTNRARNQITKLKDSSGKLQWSEGAKAEVAIDYFYELFKSSDPRSYSSVSESMVPKVYYAMNVSLTRVVSKEEVRDAIFSIKADSAPGPYGMTGLFFQRFWDVIGDQVTKEIQDVFVTGLLLSELNFTYLCLLPKVVDPELMKD